jgi:hypothetical protein
MPCETVYLSEEHVFRKIIVANVVFGSISVKSKLSASRFLYPFGSLEVISPAVKLGYCI